MAIYLVDANLPYYFQLWNNPDFVHVKDLNDSWTDEVIWQYAKDNNLIIITKDADFSSKVIYKGAPPKVIHIRFGNLRMKDFYLIISKVWIDVELMIGKANLVNVYIDRLESIS